MAGRRTNASSFADSSSSLPDRTASVQAWAADASVSAAAAAAVTAVTAAATVAPVDIDALDGVSTAGASSGEQRELPFRPTATVLHQDAATGVIRGTAVTLSIPLDEPLTATKTVRLSEPVDGQGRDGLSGRHMRPQLPKKKMLRRDSLERREALLKGKEGSRRRQRWENGLLLSNPWAEPPLPQDWEIRPTYPRVDVPYFLAPLWEADAGQRARRQSKAAKAKARSTVQSRASVLPRELRQKLKKAKSARGLLMDLETEVRQFIEDWNRRQAALERAGLPSVAEHDDHDHHHDDEQAVVIDSSDDELVFVGRQGQMKDVPPSPKTKKVRRGRSPGPARDREVEMITEREANAGRERSDTIQTATTMASSDDDMVEIEAGGDVLIMPNEKLVFGGPVEDHGASFARWIVHSIGDYYGLRTWSVTVGDPARREAYVAIDTMKLKAGRSAGQPVKQLPQPLWGMV